MPPDDRVGLDHLQARAPIRPESRPQNPQQSVAGLEAHATRCVLVENGQLVTKGENLRLPGGTGPKTGGDQSETSKTELIVEATMIPRMIITSAFSDRTEFSVSTGGLQTGHSGNSRHSAVRSVH